MRSEFEKLPEISLILHDDIFFNDVEYYSSNSLLSVNVACLNAALYAFQEQQKNLNSINQYTAAQGESIRILNEERIKQQEIINMQECAAKQIIEIIDDYESSEKPASFYIKKIKELLK